MGRASSSAWAAFSAALPTACAASTPLETDLSASLLAWSRSAGATSAARAAVLDCPLDCPVELPVGLSPESAIVPSKLRRFSDEQTRQPTETLRRGIGCHRRQREASRDQALPSGAATWPISPRTGSLIVAECQDVPAGSPAASKTQQHHPAWAGV